MVITSELILKDVRYGKSLSIFFGVGSVSVCVCVSRMVRAEMLAMLVNIINGQSELMERSVSDFTIVVVVDDVHLQPR